MTEQQKLAQVLTTVKKLESNYTFMAKNAAAFDIQTTRDFATMVKKDMEILGEMIKKLQE